jgi:hypothetical protein
MPLGDTSSFAFGTRPRRNRPVIILLLSIGAWLGAPGLAHATVSYTPRIEGVDDSKLMSTLKGLSQLFSLKDKPPDTVVGLDQRARADLDRLKPAMQGAGYWEAELDYTIGWPRSSSRHRPAARRRRSPTRRRQLSSSSWASPPSPVRWWTQNPSSPSAMATKAALSPRSLVARW